MNATIWRKRSEYSAAHVDVYSGPGFALAEAVCWTLRSLRKPYVLTLTEVAICRLLQSAGREGSARLLQSARVVTTPSHFLLEHMAPYRSDLRLQLNPIDLNLYGFKKRLNPRPKLVWLRAFHSCYNPSLAVEVIALLARDTPEIDLVMYGMDKGDGSFQAMRQLAIKLGVSERIKSPGAAPKTEVPERLAAGDIFLNTTNVDNTPISVLEAMASGLCVVSTNVGGMPYLVDHEQDGLLVPPNNPTAMAAAIRRILTEPGLAGRLSEQARKKAERFDWSRIMPQWESLLSSLAQDAAVKR